MVFSVGAKDGLHLVQVFVEKPFVAAAKIAYLYADKSSVFLCADLSSIIVRLCLLFWYVYACLEHQKDAYYSYLLRAQAALLSDTYKRTSRYHALRPWYRLSCCIFRLSDVL